MPAPGIARRLAAVTSLCAALGLTGFVVLRDPDAAPPPGAPVVRCDASADPGSLDRRMKAAKPGQTVCLAPGDYGTFAGAPLPARVALRARQPGTARMAIEFKDAANLTLDGLTVSGALLTGTTRAITIRNSTFTGFVTIDGLVDADVLLERNRHVDVDTVDGSAPARIHLGYSGEEPSGVTVRDSLLAGGDADGIQSGIGVDIIGNEFRDIRENGPNHTDAIQLVGARGSVVRGNYIHDSATGIVAFDGIAGVLIEENVIDLPDHPWGIELYSDDGSTVRHNTIGPFDCTECGGIDISRKDGAPAGAGTVIADNVAGTISVANGSTVAEQRGNLVRTGAAPADVLGTPVMRGGRRPAAYRDYRLSADSPGAGAGISG